MRSRSWTDPNNKERLLASCEVDKIAMQFGGGGHSAAAGFKINNVFDLLSIPIFNNSPEIIAKLQQMVSNDIQPPKTTIMF